MKNNAVTSGAAMVTAIHVVVTSEQTYAPPSPPHLTPPHTPSFAPSAASLHACQGHGAVSYYKRSSPSLLQETQTHRSRVPRPRSTAGLITHSRHFFWRGGDTHRCANEEWTSTERQNLELHRRPSSKSLTLMFARRLTREHSDAALFTAHSGQSRLLISAWGHGKSHLFPFKLKIK